MRRLLSPFLLTLTLIMAGVFAYLALRLTHDWGARVLLAIPFVLIWLVPALYWVGDRDGHNRFDDAIHFASYVSMGWLNFAVVLCLVRDAVLLITLSPSLAAVHAVADAHGPVMVFAGAFVALGAGMLWALHGPGVEEVDIPVEGLAPGLDGLRIVQISDLHVGPTIGRRYVRRVVDIAKALRPDLYALTGDFVDGPVARLAPELASLGELPQVAPAFFVTGNHEYYSGADAWIAYFGTLGIRVLQNEHVVIQRNGAPLLVAGVNDPTAARFDRARKPAPDRAAGTGTGGMFRLLLAHNPKLAPRAAAAGFDLQLSGHTHGGQFFPWTLAVRWIHAPHVTGLSREGAMCVYVSAGTGAWGPPVRFGTRTEVTLLRLVAAGRRA